ncbi:hypothetical protein [Roseateles amylovorans]|uniref:Uncharacterized protein n=1 Tax=Roseateles amylovorans TaxID=2978473 RepID=A0ABY6AX91_9BURK|nr:hypothetical protein [Roseateles amylovorans]UXH77806.1 hypothetical protein N4261_22985 [Roseateles amylovorans]
MTKDTPRQRRPQPMERASAPARAGAPPALGARSVAQSAGAASVQAAVEHSPQVASLAQLQRMVEASPRMHAQAHLQRALQDSSRVMQRVAHGSGVVQRDKTLALGFSELKNDVYGADFQNNQPHSTDNHLSTFRTKTGAVGPEALGFNQQADPGGQIQPQFTAGIKAAMASATKICQNLAGFTQDQINFAYQHKPELTGPEIALLQSHWDGAQRMIGGHIVNTNITGQDGNEWFAMKDLKTRPAWDPAGHDPTPHPQAWPVSRALISVWELSHHLHNQDLFNKTEFFYFDGKVNTQLDKANLVNYSIQLNVLELMTNDQLGVVPPETGLGKMVKFFKSLFE